MVLRLKTKTSKVSRKNTRTIKNKNKNKVNARHHKNHSRKIVGGVRLKPLTGAIAEIRNTFANSKKAYTEGRKAASVGHAVLGAGQSLVTAFYTPQLGLVEAASKVASKSAKFFGTKKAFSNATSALKQKYFKNKLSPKQPEEQIEGHAGHAGNVENNVGNAPPEGNGQPAGNGRPEGNGQPEGNAPPEGNGQPAGNGQPEVHEQTENLPPENAKRQNSGYLEVS